MKKHGDKLKNETSQRKAMRAKFRTGKADNTITKSEIAKTNKLHKQGRKAAFKNVAVSGEVRRKFNEANEDQNAGGEAINAGGQVVENGLYSIKKKTGKTNGSNGYGNKLHSGKSGKTAENATSHEVQKSLMKKEMQREALRDRAVDTAHSAGSLSKKFVDKAEDMAGKLAEAITEFIEEHPLGIIMAGAVLIVIIVISGAMSSCSMMAGGTNNVIIPTSYTAEDSTIVAVEGDYRAIEEALRNEINNIERNNPGYDEYNYNLAAIEH
ncbi:MAG: hypothetical protein IKY04_03645, partial [Lachnospiraceae bacterium]|nr:hypothetical protein [Lachnospiraceae bacterium]